MTIHQDERRIQQSGHRGAEVPEAFMGRMAPRFRVEGAAAGPLPAPRPVPIPVPVMTGHRFLIYKQDPSVTDLGVRLTFVPTVVLNGPADTRVRTDLAGTTPVARNANGDFVFAPNSPQFDCAHAF